MLLVAEEDVVVGKRGLHHPLALARRPGRGNVPHGLSGRSGHRCRDFRLLGRGSFGGSLAGLGLGDFRGGGLGSGGLCGGAGPLGLGCCLLGLEVWSFWLLFLLIKNGHHRVYAVVHSRHYTIVDVGLVVSVGDPGGRNQQTNQQGESSGPHRSSARRQGKERYLGLMSVASGLAGCDSACARFYNGRAPTRRNTLERERSSLAIKAQVKGHHKL